MLLHGCQGGFFGEDLVMSKAPGTILEYADAITIDAVVGGVFEAKLCNIPFICGARTLISAYAPKSGLPIAKSNSIFSPFCGLFSYNKSDKPLTIPRQTKNHTYNEDYHEANIAL